VSDTEEIRRVGGKGRGEREDKEERKKKKD
jgi:hypothetical protein